MNTTCAPSPSISSTKVAISPRYEVKTSQESMIIRVELPGVSKALTSISVDQNVLTVKGTRSGSIPSDWKVVHRELVDADYALHLRLTGPVDDQRLSAQMEDGVLTITIPVKESAKPRLIAVN